MIIESYVRVVVKVKRRDGRLFASCLISAVSSLAWTFVPPFLKVPRYYLWDLHKYKISFCAVQGRGSCMQHS
jgi:hypothetical protein